MGDLNFILQRDAQGALVGYACRGEGKGCTRNKFRTAKKACEDCVGPLDNKMTLEEVQAMLERGHG